MHPPSVGGVAHNRRCSGPSQNSILDLLFFSLLCTMYRTPLAASLTVCVTALTIALVQAEHWSYQGEYGPDNWGGYCRIGSQQSPIDLPAPAQCLPGFFEPLILVNYGSQTRINVTNNGHTLKLRVHQPCSVMIAGGGLGSTYRLEQLHFHWQSEHTVLQKRLPLELHLVHYDSKLSGVKEATRYPKGLAVIAVLFYESEEANTQVDAILKVAEQIATQVGETAEMAVRLSPDSLLPVDKSHLSYYRYHGSLTTPGCHEAVIWTVAAHKLPISREQVERFKRIQSKEGPIVNNYRPLQSLNGRRIYYHSADSATPYLSRSSFISRASFALLLPIFSFYL